MPPDDKLQMDIAAVVMETFSLRFHSLLRAPASDVALEIFDELLDNILSLFGRIPQIFKGTSMFNGIMVGAFMMRYSLIRLQKKNRLVPHWRKPRFDADTNGKASQSISLGEEAGFTKMTH